MEINLFKTKNNFKKKRIAPQADFYWKMMVLLVFIIMLGSFAFGYYIFNHVKEETFTSENIVKKQLAEKERLQKALEYFSAREKKSAEIIASPNPIVDPSI